MALTDYSTRFANFRKSPASLGARRMRKRIPTGPQNLAQALSGLGQEFFASKMESDAREKFEEDEGIRKGIENQVASILMSPNVASDVSRNQQVENIYRKAPFGDMRKEALSMAVKRQDAAEAVRAADEKFRKQTALTTNAKGLEAAREPYIKANVAFPPHLRSLETFVESLKPTEISSQTTLASSEPPLSLSDAQDVIKMQEIRLKNVKPINERIQKAKTDLQNIRNFASIIQRDANRENLKTGALETLKNDIRAFGKAVGVPVNEDQLAGGQALEGIGMQFQLGLIAGTKGAISEREMTLFERASPGMARTPEANRILLKLQAAGAQRALVLNSYKRGLMGKRISDEKLAQLMDAKEKELAKISLIEETEIKYLQKEFDIKPKAAKTDDNTNTGSSPTSGYSIVR